MRLTATLAAVFTLAMAAPAHAFEPISRKWAQPVTFYADDPELDIWTLNEAWPQIRQRGHRFAILLSAATRNRIPYPVLTGVYAVYSGLGHFSDDWFGLNENAGPPRSTGSFRRDANLAAKELSHLYRILWKTNAL